MLGMFSGRGHRRGGKNNLRRDRGRKGTGPWGGGVVIVKSRGRYRYRGIWK